MQDAGAYADLRDALLALLDDLDVAYLKWDHNRDLTDVTHAGRPAVHGQTLAAYRLLDELREAHPALEIESCSSGGGRVDAEVLTRTDRIWPSDTIDPLERQHLQRWTSLLVPPELMGSHVGGPTSHTTGRTHALRYRAAAALLLSFGIEWDLTRLDASEIAELSAWIDLHKQARPLIGSGTLVDLTTRTRPCWSPASSPQTAPRRGTSSPPSRGPPPSTPPPCASRASTPTAPTGSPRSCRPGRVARTCPAAGPRTGLCSPGASSPRRAWGCP